MHDCFPASLEKRSFFPGRNRVMYKQGLKEPQMLMQDGRGFF